MGARRLLAAVVVVVGVAFAGQALGGTELQQTLKAAKQNGENLVDVLRLALQAGAKLDDVAAAASEAGIGMDIVTAAALAAGIGSPNVASAVEQGADTNLGYMAPDGAKPSPGDEATSGAPVAVAGTGLEGSQNLVQAVSRSAGGPGPCPEEKICQPASGSRCCQTASDDNLPRCQPHDKCN